MKNKKIENIDLTQFRNRPFRFWFFAMRQKRWFGVGAMLCIVTASSLGSVTLLVIKKITNSINEFGVDAQIGHLLAIFVATSVLMNILYRVSGFLGSWWITHMELFASQISFDHIIKHSAGYFANRLSGKLQNKIFNIAHAMDALTGQFLWNFVSFFMKIVIFSILSFMAHWIMGIIIIGITGIILLYNIFIAPIRVASAKKYTESLSRAKGLLVDIIGNILASKQNVALQRESRNAKKVLSNYQIEHARTWRLLDITLLFNNFLAILIVGAMLFTSLHLWKLGLITAGDIMMFITMLLSLYATMESLGGNLSRFMEEAGKLQEGLEEIFVPHEIVDKKNAKKVTLKNGDIVFDKVNFHYKEDKNKSIFKNLSLTIPAGQKIGLVGESGAGKSTFVSLLLRFMDLENGSIKIDGQNISEIRQDDLRQAIAYVPQDALLFHRTIEENIKYSYPRASKKEIQQAAQRAYALDFINSFPKKFKTLVGERGVKLSGGQKQRVMIARAMLKKSPILVLDEATSSLDSKAEQAIQKALEELMKGRTTIAIAHRLSTLKQMDRIIVFDNGKITEDGTHSELLKLKGKYWELWQHQS